MSVQVECTACGAKNRVPPERLTDDPRCGGCKESLAPGLAGVDLDAMFGDLFGAVPRPAAPAVENGSSALRIALTSTGLGEPRQVREALLLPSGLWGLTLGPLLMAAGAIVGTVLINALLSVIGVSGSAPMPVLVLCLAYAGAFYGGLITLTASARVLQVVWPATATTAGLGRAVRLGVAVIVGFAQFVAIWLLVAALGLADFGLR